MKIRAARPSISFARVREECLHQVVTLALRLIPGGKWSGDWYMVRVPWRDDKSASLQISRTTARWWDRGYEDADNGGTLIDLVIRLDRCSTREAKEKIAAMCGLSPGGVRETPPRPKPRCQDCAHVWHRFDDTLALRHDGDGPPDVADAYDKRFCTVVVDRGYCAAGDGMQEPYPTRLARRSRWPCGPFGKLFTPAHTDHLAACAEDMMRTYSNSLGKKR